jgi:hypothetical protein|tara:strand:+ start:1200 stop:1823 length:624 start_codon:yes stop_codon:yes gene_type:complete
LIDDTPKHPFNVLRKDEFKQSIEKKGKFDYLSWAICWDKLKECDPNARYELVDIIETGQSKLVHVRLRYDWDGDECIHDEYLAVRDYRNQAVSNPDAAQVENTFRRAVAKAVSMATGYGLDLWINEDIRDLDYVPNTIKGKMPEQGKITPDQTAKLDRLSRSNYLTKNGQAKVMTIMKDETLLEKEVNDRIAEIEKVIKERRTKEKN